MAHAAAQGMRVCPCQFIGWRQAQPFHPRFCLLKGFVFFEAAVFNKGFGHLLPDGHQRVHPVSASLRNIPDDLSSYFAQLTLSEAQHLGPADFYASPHCGVTRQNA